MEVVYLYHLQQCIFIHVPFLSVFATFEDENHDPQ